MIPQPQTSPASLAYAEVLKRFRGRGALRLVAFARMIARGHEIHRLALAEKKPRTAGGRSEQRREMARATELELFWSAIGARHGMIDLVEEHSAVLPPVLVAILERETERTLREIWDPPGNEGLKFHNLVPPAKYLPDDYGQLVATILGEDLTGNSSDSVATIH